MLPTAPGWVGAVLEELVAGGRAAAGRAERLNSCIRVGWRGSGAAGLALLREVLEVLDAVAPRDEARAWG